MKRFVSLAWFVAAVVATASARADDDACISAYTQAQTLRKDGKIVSAKAQASICAQSSCNALLAKDCTRWLGELEAVAPSVVFEVRGPSGAEIVDVRVTMDGEPLTNRLDGKAIEIDPGAHTFSFEAPGSASLEKSFVIREGEKGRKLKVALSRGAPVPPARPIPLGVYVFGGATVVALGLSAVFALDGLSRKDDLEACKPRCAPEEVDAMSSSFTVADVALGAGLMAAAAATYLFLTRPSVAAGSEGGRIGIVPNGPRGGVANGLTVRF